MSSGVNENKGLWGLLSHAGSHAKPPSGRSYFAFASFVTLLNRAMALGHREIMRSSQILSKSEQVFCCLQDYLLDWRILRRYFTFQCISKELSLMIVLILLPNQLSQQRETRCCRLHAFSRTMYDSKYD